VYSPLANTGRTPYQARPELYSAYSVVDDAKDKAKKLSDEATREFEKASSKAQAKAGKIELFSPKYYAACTIGGLMACVSPFVPIASWKKLIGPISLGLYPRRCNPS
jgi:solute carrier family 25 phosphate transporter 3